jgi:hypothetical protein
MDKKQRDAVMKLDAALATVVVGIDQLRSDLRDEFTELSETLQGSLKGEKLQAELDALEDASNALGEAMAALSSAVA